jgi:hypothetical protein
VIGGGWIDVGAHGLRPGRFLTAPAKS